MSLGLVVLCLAVLEGGLRWLDWGDPPVYEPRSPYGYLMRPNQSVSTRGHRFRINQAGLRGNDFPFRKPSEVYRIAFVGESVTFGGGAIPDHELFVNRVASLLGSQEGRRVEAVNIAAPGWGVANMAAYVEAVGVFDADVVVWVLSSADFLRPKTSPADHALPTEKRRFRLQHAMAVSARRAYIWLRQRPRPAQATSANPALLQRNLETLRHALTQLTRKGTGVVVVVVPSVNGYEVPEEFAAFRSETSACRVPFLDTAPILLGPQAKEFFMDDIHLSRRGHEAVAGEIARFLEQQMFRPPEHRGEAPKE